MYIEIHMHRYHLPEPAMVRLVEIAKALGKATQGVFPEWDINWLLACMLQQAMCFRQGLETCAYTCHVYVNICMLLYQYVEAPVSVFRKFADAEQFVYMP
jgi:hypothetical protein